jgi:hypothetical protein
MMFRICLMCILELAMAQVILDYDSSSYSIQNDYNASIATTTTGDNCHKIDVSDTCLVHLNSAGTL